MSDPMGHVAAMLLAVSWRDKLESMSWLELILWFGLATLTVSLLVLMGTRWGQVRPVSKCVVLSVLAHLLFLCYAYGTRLSLNGGSLLGDPFLRVSYVGSEIDTDVVSAPGAELPPFPDGASTPPNHEPIDLQSQVPFPMAQEEGAPPESVASVAIAEAPAAEPVMVPPPEPQQIAATPPSLPAQPSPEVSPPSAKEQVVDSTADDPLTRDVIDSEREIQVDSPPVPATVSKPASIVAPVEPVSVDQPPVDAPSSRVVEVPPSPPTHNISSTTRNDATIVRPHPAPSVTNDLRVEQQAPPDPYRLRTSPDRLRLAIPFGATEETEASVAAALDWLAANQQSDGRWDASDFGAGRETRTLGQDRRGAGADADTGITGLALLAFLGAGQTHLSGTHHLAVQHGLEFLLRSQDSEGNLAGDAKLFERMYCHGIAGVAIGEAFAMTGDSRLLPGLQRAVQYSLSAQDRTSGGWRYQPAERGDMSQFGWQVMALRSAELGGIPIPASNRNLMVKFLDSVSQGPHKGRASYRPGERTTRTMTAEALTCRFFLALPVTDAMRNEATEFVLQELPGQDEPNLYYWYYATLCLFQVQGNEWKLWNKYLQRNLLERQRRDGPYSGSWDTRDVWGGYGGRIYTTAMATLCLEVYYRYLPIYGSAVPGEG